MKLNKSVLQLVAGIVLVMVLTTLVKVALNAHDEFNQAEERARAGDFTAALVHYERSLRWYLPGLGTRGPAAEAMWTIGSRFERDGDIENALDAFRLLRSAFYSARSLYTPGRDWIARCNDKIAALMAGKPAATGTEAAKSFEQRKEEALRVLSEERPPHTGWAVVTEAGFLGWVLCGFLFIARAFTRTGNFQGGRPALVWGGGFLLAYGLWVLGLFNV